MIVVTHFISFLVNEHFTLACLREMRDVTCEVVKCLKQKREAMTGPMRFTKYNRPFMFQKVLYVVTNEHRGFPPSCTCTHACLLLIDAHVYPF